MTEIFVHVHRAHGADIHPEDANVEGVYAINLADEINPLWHMDAALEGFHSREPVKVLDDFNFEVKDGMGRLLEPATPTPAGYVLDKFVVCGHKVQGPDAPRPLTDPRAQLAALAEQINKRSKGARA